MPTYNCGEYIYFAVNSILNQSFREFEFIVVDDGSTDNTEDTINAFKDSRIRYFRLDHKGFVDSTNFGISKASSEWIARMDADDIALPERFKKQIDHLNKNPELTFISCWYAVFSGTKNSYIVRTPVTHDQILKQLSLHSVICHPGTIFNKKDFNLANRYVPDTREDYDLWLRMKDRTSFYNYPEVLMFLRERKNSLSRRSYINNGLLMKKSQEKYLDLKTDFGIEDPIAAKIVFGWREWFYGDQINSRKIWKEVGISRLSTTELMAYMLSFLSQSSLIRIKQANLRLRLNYLYKENIKHNEKLNRQLQSLLILK